MAGTRLKQKLTAIADSIRHKLPSTALMTLAEMPPNIEDIVTHEIEDALVDRSLDGVYNNPRVTQIGNNCLRVRRITQGIFENVDIIGSSAFYGCASLETVIIPKVTRIGDDGFRTCSMLSLLNLYSPDRTEIPSLWSRGLVGTAIESGNGYIVINDNLVDSLKEASNWSNYAAQIIGHTQAIALGLITGASTESATVPAPAPLQTIPSNRLDIDEINIDLDRDLDLENNERI